MNHHLKRQPENGQSIADHAMPVPTGELDVTFTMVKGKQGVLHV